MYCRYKCEHCGEMHPLAGIDTFELIGAWLEFMARPPEPFTRAVWDIILKAEMRRRGLYLV